MSTPAAVEQPECWDDVVYGPRALSFGNVASPHPPILIRTEASSCGTFAAGSMGSFENGTRRASFLDVRIDRSTKSRCDVQAAGIGGGMAMGGGMAAMGAAAPVGGVGASAVGAPSVAGGDLATAASNLASAASNIAASAASIAESTAEFNDQFDIGSLVLTLMILAALEKQDDEDSGAGGAILGLIVGLSIGAQLAGAGEEGAFGPASVEMGTGGGVDVYA